MGDMNFKPENGTQEIVEALEATASFSDGMETGKIQLWENVPPALLEVRDGFASLVLPPAAIPIGPMEELKDENGNVNNRTKVRIRRLVRELEQYREETIIKGGEIMVEAIQRCAGTEEPFLMIYKSLGEEQMLGVVMIIGFSNTVKEGPMLHYYFKQGYIWGAAYLKLDNLDPQCELRLIRLPDSAKDY